MSAVTAPNPSARLSTIFTVAIALSIGWGIRGNFGHEYGAMMPGCLAAMAGCIMSGREDWRGRIVYFAFFGALGWGFGATISYMQVVSYTHSGHWPSQLWGFGGLFLIGFLWAGMGGAGTALPAVASRDQLTRFFKPLCWIFFFWTLYKYWGEAYIVRIAMIDDWAESRHESPYYWFDTDWLQACIALAAVCLYDLWNRRSETGKYALGHAGLAAITTYIAVAIMQTVFGNTSTFFPVWMALLAGFAALTISILANPLQKPAAIPVAAFVAILTAIQFVYGVMALLDFYEASAWIYMPLTLLAVVIYDLWNRDFTAMPAFTAFAAAGILAGAVVFWFLGAVGALQPIGNMLTRSLADPTMFIEARELGMQDDRFTDEERALLAQYNGDFNAFQANPPADWPESDPDYLQAEVLFDRAIAIGMQDPAFTEQQRALLQRYEGDRDAFMADTFVNWPQLITDNKAVQKSLGWFLGMVVFLIAYYAIFGRFRNGSRLFLYMSAGWLIGFLILPVGLGIRLTPPRSDDWAGIIGVWCGAMIYLLRSGLAPVVYASIVSGVIGGFAFAGTAFWKLVLVRPGNPKVVSNPDIIEYWSHWQHSNWHSWLEQTYGFVNGIGIAVALALIARKVRPVSDVPRTSRWTEVFSAFFILFILTYLNWFKNVSNWIGMNAVQADMQMPLFSKVWLIPGSDLTFHAETWFTIVYAIVSVMALILLVRHLSRPLPFIPASSLGKAQLMLLVFLWVVVLYNLDRAIPGFRDGRLLTEAVIIINAGILTMLITLFARERDSQAHIPHFTKPVNYARAFAIGILVFAASTLLHTAGTQALYGDAHAGHSGRDGLPQTRFGPDAEWRIVPLAKTKAHN